MYQSIWMNSIMSSCHPFRHWNVGMLGFRESSPSGSIIAIFSLVNHEQLQPEFLSQDSTGHGNGRNHGSIFVVPFASEIPRVFVS